MRVLDVVRIVEFVVLSEVHLLQHPALYEQRQRAIDRGARNRGLDFLRHREQIFRGIMFRGAERRLDNSVPLRGFAQPFLLDKSVNFLPDLGVHASATIQARRRTVNRAAGPAASPPHRQSRPRLRGDTRLFAGTTERGFFHRQTQGQPCGCARFRHREKTPQQEFARSRRRSGLSGAGLRAKAAARRQAARETAARESSVSAAATPDHRGSSRGAARPIGGNRELPSRGAFSSRRQAVRRCSILARAEKTALFQTASVPRRRARASPTSARTPRARSRCWKPIRRN